MIDREVRNQYGELIRRFASGSLTNFDYDAKANDLCERTDDTAIPFIYWALWGLYDDTYQHRLTGSKRLDYQTRQMVARCILFLQTDAEYAGKKPPRRPLLRRLLSWLTMGIIRENYAVLKESDADAWYEKNVWPFTNRHELRVALHRPKFLAKRVA